MSKYKAILFDWEGVVGPQDTQSFGWLMERLTTEYGVEKEQVVAALSGAIGDFLVGKIDNRTTRTVYEYGGNDEINGAVAEIDGRYPETGWAVNTEVSEIIFVLEGSGELITKERRVTLAKAALAVVETGEAYYFEGKSLRVFIAYTPPWTPEQYKVME